jgi:hypothetical protein
MRFPGFAQSFLTVPVADLSDFPREKIPGFFRAEIRAGPVPDRPGAQERGVNPGNRPGPRTPQTACQKGAKERFFRARKGHENINSGINLLIQKRKGPFFLEKGPVLEILAREKVYPGPYRARIEGGKAALHVIVFRPTEDSLRVTGNDTPLSAR